MSLCASVSKRAIVSALLQSLEAPFIVMYRGCCILLLLCQTKCSVFFTPMCGERGLVLHWWQEGKIKESSKTPNNCLKCTRPWCKQVQPKDFMFCEIIKSWVQVKNAGWRFPGWCLLSSQPPASALFAQNVQQMFYQTWDGRLRFLEDEFSSCLLFFATLSMWMQHCTQLQHFPHILLPSDSFIHFSAV